MFGNVAAACMLLLSIYAQWSLTRQIEGERRVRVTQMLLALVGTALGLLAVNFAHLAELHDTSRLALFLIGFGQVHAPASVILLLKSQRAQEQLTR